MFSTQVEALSAVVNRPLFVLARLRQLAQVRCYLATLLPCYPTTLLPHDLATSRPHDRTTLLLPQASAVVGTTEKEREVMHKSVGVLGDCVSILPHTLALTLTLSTDPLTLSTDPLTLARTRTRTPHQVSICERIYNTPSMQRARTPD